MIIVMYKSTCIPLWAKPLEKWWIVFNVELIFQVSFALYPSCNSEPWKHLARYFEIHLLMPSSTVNKDNINQVSIQVAACQDR